MSFFNLKFILLSAFMVVLTVTQGCSGGSGSDNPTTDAEPPATEDALRCEAGDWRDGDLCRRCSTGTWSAADATECLQKRSQCSIDSELRVNDSQTRDNECVPCTEGYLNENEDGTGSCQESIAVDTTVTIVSACVSMDCVGYDCGSRNNPYGINQVQQAIAHAGQQGAEQNVVYLTPGRYVPEGCPNSAGDCEGNARLRHFSLANNVAVIGGYVLEGCGDGAGAGAGDTLLSGDLNGDDDMSDVTSRSDNTYHVFYHPESSALKATATLTNVTIIGGRANAESPHNSGAGMYNFRVSPVLVDVVLTRNEAIADGGGMANIAADVILDNVTFTGNKADNGGGLLNGGCDPQLSRVSFGGNVAISAGGGMFNESAGAVIVQSHFSDNRAEYGGAIFNGGSSVLLLNSSMTGNSAYEGGAMYNGGSEPMLVNVVISANTADHAAGGIFNAGSNPQSTNVTVTQNAAQEAGAVFNGGSMPEWKNSIIWGNTAADYVGLMADAAYSLFGELNDCDVESCPTEGDAGNRVGLMTSPFAQTLTPECLGDADSRGDWAAFFSAMTSAELVLSGIAEDVESLLLYDAYGHLLPDFRQSVGNVNIGAVHTCL